MQAGFPLFPLPNAMGFFLPDSAALGLGIPGWGKTPHSQRKGVLQSFLNSPPLVSLYMVSSMILRCNISNQLHFTWFFKLIAQHFTVNLVPNWEQGLQPPATLQ